MGEPWKEGKTGFEGNKYIFCFDLVTLNSRKKENVQLKERKVKLQNTHTHTLPCYTKMIRCALNYSRIYKRSKWELERGDILCVAIRLQNEKDVLTQFCAPDNFGRTRQSQRIHSFTCKRKFILCYKTLYFEKMGEHTLLLQYLLLIFRKTLSYYWLNLSIEGFKINC